VLVVDGMLAVEVALEVCALPQDKLLLCKHTQLRLVAVDLAQINLESKEAELEQIHLLVH
jgi:hypothetical protein